MNDLGTYSIIVLQENVSQNGLFKSFISTKNNIHCSHYTIITCEYGKLLSIVFNKFSSSFSANLRGLFSSYEDQHFFESIIMEKELSTAPRAVIMGDLNCGPRVPNTNVKEEFQCMFELS